MINPLLARTIEIIRLILLLTLASATQLGRSAEPSESFTKLHRATISGDQAAIAALFDSGVNLYEADVLNNSIAYYAAMKGHWDIVEMMFKRGYDPLVLRRGHPQLNTVYQRGLEILPFAVKQGRLDWVKRLLNQGVDIDTATATRKEADPLLVSAIANRRNEIAAYLLEAKCPLEGRLPLDPPFANYSSITALQMTICYRNKDLLAKLLSAGASIDERNGMGLSALMIAADQDWVEGVNILLTARASLDGKDVSGKDVYAYAEPHPASRQAIAQSMIGPASADQSSLVRQFHLAIRTDEQGKVARLLQTTPYLGTKTDAEGTPPILVAAVHGRKEITILLLKAKADPNQPKPDGDTALYEAIIHHHPDIARLLLDAGADPNRFAPTDWAPLERAINLKQFEIAHLLLEKGASPNLESQGLGWRGPPLCHAAQTGNLALVQALVNKGANLQAKDSDGVNAILYACEHAGTPEVIQYLVGHGLDINEVSPNGDTPLAKAIAFSAPGVVRKTLELGAKPANLDAALNRLTRARKNSAEIFAILQEANALTADDIFWLSQPTREQIMKFVTEGGDPNNGGGEPPLSKALGSGDFALAKFLLDHRASPSFSGNIHQSPLCALVAGARKGEDEAVEIGRHMFALGANPNGNAVEEGASIFGPIPPIRDAVLTGRVKLVELFLEFGADPAPGLKALDERGQALPPDVQVQIRNLLNKKWPKPVRL